MAKKVKTNKRQIILEEAAKLFKAKGFGGTSMRDLGSQVGMEAASSELEIARSAAVACLWAR